MRSCPGPDANPTPMPMIQDILTSSLRGALVAVGVAPVPERIPVERSNRPELGDWSSSVALAVAKSSGRKPRDLAAELAAQLSKDPPAYGAALCRILERCGYGVHREYYLNDRGVQMGLLAASVAATKAGDPLPED